MDIKRDGWKNSIDIVLEDCEKVLAKPDMDSMSLWWILTALRGPDAEFKTLDGKQVKKATTAVIRHKAFPSIVIGTSNPDSSELKELRAELLRSNENRHFVAHAMRAFRELGLEW